MSFRKLLWCRIAGHNWRVLPFPGKRVAIYCQRCTQARLLDRDDPQFIWIATHQSTKRYRRRIRLPFAQVRKP